MEVPSAFGVAEARGLGSALSIEGGDVGVRVDGGDASVELCVAVAVVSLQARSYPSSVKEYLK